MRPRARFGKASGLSARSLIDQKTRISVSKSGIRANTPVMRIIKKKLLTSTTFDAA
jgi:hypothetical protein